ncbi:NAD(P)-binding protein [Rostrohypoxylon terebratum]|nr:NAD(P)-binding protein [Rostrohypoxylon terebratum]
MATSAANREAISKFTSIIHKDTYEYISPKKLNLSGRSVFITGASKGVGKETALSFAAAGCSKIGIGARSDLAGVAAVIKEAARKAGRKDEPQVVTVKIDVTSEASVEAAAKIVSDEFGGKLDILINNAGYLPEWLQVATSKTDEWWTTYEVNVKGVYLCSRYFIPLLLEGSLKTNVLTTSAGAIAVMPSGSAYQSSKFTTELAFHMPKPMHAILVDEPQLPGDCVVWLTSEKRPWLNGRFLEARKDDIVKQDLLKFRMTTAM